MNTTPFELVVGLEVHVQLATASKIFCACSTSFGDAPNRNTCPVCLGLPGALPVLNAHAVQLAVRAALAFGCTVHATSVFARKNYFYPDLPKGYQISQFEAPLATGGALTVPCSRHGEAHVGITRVHMEEDAGKSIHDRYSGYTAIDLNRTGVPLIEIVSEPDIRSAEVAGNYLRSLKQILEYTEVSDANMEEGSLRVDVNISARRQGDPGLGTKTEIKNLNTFSGVERAIELEFARHCALLEQGAPIHQQTMLWDGSRVRPARSKEESHDYRYFPDPDLPPLVLTENFIAGARDALPELPLAKRERLRTVYGLTPAESGQLTASRHLAAFYEAVARESGDGKRAANWVLGAILASMNANNWNPADYPVSPARLGALIQLEASGTLSNAAARQLLPRLEQVDEDPLTLARQEGLLKVTDESQLDAWIVEAMAEHPDESRRFLEGERKLQGVLVGFVMKKSGGSADPKLVNRLLASRLR